VSLTFRHYPLKHVSNIFGYYSNLPSDSSKTTSFPFANSIYHWLNILLNQDNYSCWRTVHFSLCHKQLPPFSKFYFPKAEIRSNAGPATKWLPVRQCVQYRVPYQPRVRQFSRPPFLEKENVPLSEFNSDQ